MPYKPVATRRKPCVKLLMCSAIGAVWFALPVSADQIMFSYNTELSVTDAFSSSGQPLEGWCSLIQQDRANWHRFNKRDPEDEPDPFFGSPEHRAMIAGKCEIGSNQFADPGDQIRTGNRQFYITVQVFGTGGQVMRIAVSDGF